MCIRDSLESVHFEAYPETNEALIDSELEERMGLVITLVSLGRSIRNKVQIKVRQPLRKLMVNEKHHGVLGNMEGLVKEELNVKEIAYVSTMSDYVSYEVRPNLPVAGPKYGKNLRGITGALSHADAAEVARTVETQGSICMRCV